MPASLASFLTLAFVLYLFRRDIYEKANVTNAIWIPTLWLLIISTRPVSMWLAMFGLYHGSSSLEDGSPVDALASFALIAAGVKILLRRRVQLASVIRNNRFLAVYLAYCFLAITWSDFPFVALKRWFKDLGHPIMVLILLTEPDVTEAVTRFLKRCAYVVAPFSILFIKYYPEWGRGFDVWSGAAFNMGVAEGKNQLGNICLILAFFYVWHLLVTLRSRKSNVRRDELLLSVGFLAMIGWLFYTANSKTPLVAMVAGLAILLFTSLRWVKKSMVGTYLLIGGLALGAAQAAFGIYEATLELLGRNASLTDRVPLWEELRKWGDQSPILGAGFESFWLGERQIKFWIEWQVGNAHSGYLETYLDMGLLGLLLLLGLLVTIFFKARAALLRDNLFGRFRFGFFFSVIIYSLTEASLHGVHPVFFMLFLIGMDYPYPRTPIIQDAPSGTPFPTTEHAT